MIINYKKRVPESQFRKYYDRGDLPIKMEQLGNRIVWKVPC